MHFMLRASDVSALCGRNCYRDRASAIKTLVESNVPPLIDPPAYRDVLWELEELVRSGPVYTEALTSRSLGPRLASEAERESLGYFNRFATDFPMNEKRRLRNHIRTLYLKDRGLVMEVDTLRRLEEETRVAWWPTDRRRRFFTRTFVMGDNISYTINGSVDGFEKNGDDVSGLLEVKNRRDRIFHHDHDIDQIVLYMVLSGLDTGRLVQTAGGHIDATLVITRPEAVEKWTTVLKPLLETALHEAAGRVRHAAVEAAALWRPFSISHVVVNPPPCRKWRVDCSTQTL